MKAMIQIPAIEAAEAFLTSGLTIGHGTNHDVIEMARGNGAGNVKRAAFESRDATIQDAIAGRIDYSAASGNLYVQPQKLDEAIWKLLAFGVHVRKIAEPLDGSADTREEYLRVIAIGQDANVILALAIGARLLTEGKTA